MTKKAIGSTFSLELKTAGLLGLPFTWGADGVIQFGAAMTTDQIAAVNSVYAAHDPSKVDLTGAAQAALDKSDITLLRCIDAGVTFPTGWTTYRTALRAIVSGASTPASLPSQPAFPTGS